MKASVICVVLCMVAGAYAYKSGAPKRQCEEMRPYHEGSEPQTGPSPYKVSFSKNSIRPGERIVVKITGTNGENFKGYMIQARVGNTPVGQFSQFGNTVADSTQTIDCGDSTQNTATHTKNDPRSQVNLYWTAPKNLSETVIFKYTVVKDYTTYWVAQNSPKLTIVGRS